MYGESNAIDQNYTLHQFSLQFNDEYYGPIHKLADETRNAIVGVLESGDDLLFAFASQCKKMMDQLGNFLNYRKEELMPYLAELEIKALEKHNCAQCSGKCDMQHSLKIAALNEYTAKLKEMFLQLHIAARPIYRHECNEYYALLRYYIMAVDRSLTELFFMEEARLIPAILKTQNQINAHS